MPGHRYSRSPVRCRRSAQTRYSPRKGQWRRLRLDCRSTTGAVPPGLGRRCRERSWSASVVVAGGDDRGEDGGEPGGEEGEVAEALLHGVTSRVVMLTLPGGVSAAARS